MDADGKDYVYEISVFNTISTKKEVPPLPTKQGNVEVTSNFKVTSESQDVKIESLSSEFVYLTFRFLFDTLLMNGDVDNVDMTCSFFFSNLCHIETYLSSKN